MLKRFDRKDQQGAVRANTVLKVLGRSSLFILDILIREAIQNSLDAVSDKCKNHVRFDFQLLQLGDHAELVKRIGFLKQRGADPVYSRLIERISQNDPVMLLLVDKGTTGLSGPVRRSDRTWDSYTGRRNFENLVYELGQNHEESGAGGSYGFGKTIFYHLSSAGLVLFYSKSKEGERLAFTMISEEEYRICKSSTGIAFWGNTYKYDGIEFAAPIENSEQIKDILQKMGLINWRFKASETGTLVCVIAPKLQKLLTAEPESRNSDLSPEDNRLHLDIKRLKVSAEQAVLRWFWPRMTETNEVSAGGILKPLKVFICGTEVKLDTHHVAMGELLKAAENSNNNIINASKAIRTEKVTHHFGSADLGTVAYQIIDLSVNAFHLNKISMIRAPRMVVFEVPVQERPNKSVAALFLVNSKERVWPNNNHRGSEKQYLDDAFKDCESATHSEWNYQDLGDEKSWFRTYVKSATEKASKIIYNALNPIAKQPPITGISSAAKLLGRLLTVMDDGEVQTFNPRKTGTGGKAVGNKSGSAIPKPSIGKLEFTDGGDMVLTIFIEGMSKGKYELALLAKGGNQSMDKKYWKKGLGKEFPFTILKGSSSNDIGELKIKDGAFIHFTVKTQNLDKTEIKLTIHPVKRDALMTFRITKLTD